MLLWCHMLLSCANWYGSSLHTWQYHEVQKITDDYLKRAEKLRLDNLNQIAAATKEVSQNNTHVLIQDFVEAALLATTEPPQANGTATVSDVDQTNTEMLGESMFEDGGEEQSPSVLSSDGSSAGDDSFDMTDLVTNLVMGIAEKTLNVPRSPTVIDPDDTPTETANATFDDNPYLSILEVGENTTAGSIAKKALFAKEAARLVKSVRESKKHSWASEIESKAMLKGRMYIMEHDNHTRTLMHEKLRQDLFMSDNETKEMIEEHLFENKVASTTFDGKRVVLEYTTIAREMRYNSDVEERANEALGTKMERVVLPQLITAYTPLMNYKEEHFIETNAKTQAERLVQSRLDAIVAERIASEQSKLQAEMNLQKAMDSITNRGSAVQVQIDAKVEQVYNYVQQYGDQALNAKMQAAMSDLKDAQTAMSGGGSEALGAAAAASVELDAAVSLASSTIGGSVGNDIFRLKLEIDQLKNPPDNVADDVTAGATFTPNVNFGPAHTTSDVNYGPAHSGGR